MKTVYGFFAARRYWKQEDALRNAYEGLRRFLGCDEDGCALVVDGDGKVPSGDCLVAVPMSGAVQRDILNAAERFSCAVVFAAYVRGNAPQAEAGEMLRCNAAPTVMDCWAVLRRTHPRAELATSPAELQKALKVFQAFHAVRGATLLRIGETEPWVISGARSPESYERRFGIRIQPVEQAELAARYHAATPRQAEPYVGYFRKAARGMREPGPQDLEAAGRMASALLDLLQGYGAQGAALACFDLLRVGTTACLGVSYVNERTGMVAACEGDLDSAVTMLLMKGLTDTRLWMANPGLQPDGSVNFSHCTAPVRVQDGPVLPCILRSHHESGIGVSLQVQMPVGAVVTAGRVSDEARSITVHRGVVQEGPYEPACRTQMHVRLEDPAHYRATALGCHQVFAFEDISDELRRLGNLFGLNCL